MGNNNLLKLRSFRFFLKSLLRSKKRERRERGRQKAVLKRMVWQPLTLCSKTSAGAQDHNLRKDRHRRSTRTAASRRRSTGSTTTSRTCTSKQTFAAEKELVRG